MSHKNHDSESKIEIEKTMRPEEAALLLMDLASQMRDTGRLEITQGNHTLVLPLKSNMFLELKAKMKKGKSKMSIELEWVSDVLEAIVEHAMHGETNADTVNSQNPEMEDNESR